MDRNTHKIKINTPDPGYEPFPISIMNRYTYEAMTFDPYLGKPATISYSLNKSGCIRVRLVRREQPKLILRTLQDWTEQGFGTYELKWDGCDASGNIVDNKKIVVLFEAKDQGGALQHREHDENSCQDPLLTLETIPDPSETIEGIFDIRTNLIQVAENFGNKDGLEVRYFVDYELLKTERFENHVKRFDVQIDTRSLTNGEHLITVNVDDFHDHIGSAGVKIKVEN